MEGSVERNAILDNIISLLKDMTSDWEMGFLNPIGQETLFVADLGFKSIQFVELAIAIESRFKSQNLPFQELFTPDKGEFNDLRVSELVDFLYVFLNRF